MYYKPTIKYFDCFLYVTREFGSGQPVSFDIYEKDTRVVRNLSFYDDIIGKQPIDLHDDGLALSQTGDNGAHLKAWVYNQCVSLEFTGLVCDKPLTLSFSPDATDVFEVRGLLADQLNRQIEVNAEMGELNWFYDGRDGIRREAGVSCTGHAGQQGFTRKDDTYTATFVPKDDRLLVRFYCGDLKSETSYEALQNEFDLFAQDFDLEKFDGDANWVRQAVTDMFVLRGSSPKGGICFHAGTPWFACLFGRDSLITAEQCLSVAPFVAKTALQALGAFQATAYDAASDAEPGKIIHEARRSERCNMGDAPFGRYYGGIDTTLLYVSLAARYLRETGDTAFIQEIASILKNATGWMLDRLSDGDFIAYRANKEAEGELGLDEKGWKDGAPVIHANGKPAIHPIALCEVQGYAYRALLDSAWLAETVFGEPAQAVDLRRKADALKIIFNERFWCEEIGTYALAIDGAGKPCRVVTTNPGHLLRTGIVDDAARIDAIAQTFADPNQLFSGWGLRTLSYADKSFDPASYQLGGVWPHDTTECIRGLLAVGHDDLAQRLTAVMEELAEKFDGRLPELISGHPRKGNEIIAYFNSCSPQAWAASIPFALSSVASPERQS